MNVKTFKSVQDMHSEIMQSINAYVEMTFGFDLKEEEDFDDFSDVILDTILNKIGSD